MSRPTASPTSRSISTTRPPTRWSRRRCKRWPPVSRRQVLDSLQDAHHQRRGDHLRHPVHHLVWIGGVPPARRNRRADRSADALHHGARVRPQLQRIDWRPRQVDDPVAELPLSLGDRADPAGGRRRWPGAADPLAAGLRLASTIWETTPDDTLLQAAQAGQLTTAAQVASQVTRMVADPRAANGLFYFHEQWLFNFGSQGRDLTQPLTKSSPLFTAAVAQGIATEFSDFVSSVYTGDGTLQSLFTAPYTYVNHDLGVIYGVTGTGDRVRQGRARSDEARRRLHPDRLPGDARQRRRRQPDLSRPFDLSQGPLRNDRIAARQRAGRQLHRQRDDPSVV